jgi:DNA anti-recombination protein RmuC
LYGIRTPDFVLLFVPVEPAFVLALREKQELFEDIGRRLKAAQSSYDDAYGKLASGKGNLIRQVERIRELGLKPSKPLPASSSGAAP